MIKDIIAKKTKNKTQNLLEHSKEVFENCLKNMHLINKNFLKNLNEQYLEQDFKKILFFISFFHDIGKMDVNFQNFINKEDENYLLKKDEENDLNNYLEHHIISYYIFKLLNINNSIINDDIKDVIKYCILYHHSFNPLNENSVKFLDNDFFKDNVFKKLIKSTLEKILKENNDTLLYYLSNVNNEYKTYFDEELNIELKTIPMNLNDFCLFPSYKDIKVFDNQSIKYNALKTTIKLFFNTIDRKTSFSFEFDKSIDFENKNFEKDAHFYLDNDEKFPLNNERTKAQNKVIEEILKNYSNNNISVLNGAAGVGKTRIFLKIFKELMQENKQMFIVVPRNTIAESLYEEFKQQYYFNDSISIEILNNEREDVFFKNNENEISDVSNPYNSNIVIITIDRLTKLLNDNHLIYNFERLLNSFIVFDEFHEIFYLDSLYIYFKEVIETFSFFNNSKVLLTSGTINPFFVKSFLEIEEKNIFKLDSFNNQFIHVIFSNLDEDSKKEIVNNSTINLIQNKKIKYLKDYKEKIQFQIEKGLANFIDIQEKIINSQRNTIFYLQEISKIKENLTNNIINIHSYFNKEDKKSILECLLKECKKITHTFKVYSAPIIQASVNVTCRYMFTNYSTPDNLLQRLGRLNRFAELENKDCSYFFINYEQEKNIKNIKDDTLKQQEKINHLFINFLLRRFYEDNEKYCSGQDKDDSQFIDFIININQFRRLYDEFFNEEDVKKEFKQLLDDKFDKISNMILKEVLPFDYSFIENDDQKNNNQMCLTYRGKSGIKISVNKTTIDISNMSNEKSSDVIDMFLDNNKTKDIINIINGLDKGVLKDLQKDNNFFKEYKKKKYENISDNEKLRIITTKKGYAVPFNRLKNGYVYIYMNNIILGLIEENKLAELSSKEIQKATNLKNKEIKDAKRKFK